MPGHDGHGVEVMAAVDRAYCDARMHGIAEKIDSLALLMRREFELLAEDRDRQRNDLRERLEGMNALRAQLDRQAGTFVTRERIEVLERHTWRAIGLLTGIIAVIAVVAVILTKGVP